MKPLRVLAVMPIVRYSPIYRPTRLSQRNIRFGSVDPDLTAYHTFEKLIRHPSLWNNRFTGLFVADPMTQFVETTLQAANFGHHHFQVFQLLRDFARPDEMVRYLDLLRTMSNQTQRRFDRSRIFHSVGGIVYLWDAPFSRGPKYKNSRHVEEYAQQTLLPLFIQHCAEQYVTENSRELIRLALQNARSNFTETQETLEHQWAENDRALFEPERQPVS